MPKKIGQLFLTLVLLLICALGQAQHYFFIEADAQRPFYVRIDDKTYASSPSGFLILPKISAPSLDLVIGFQDKLGQEKTFAIRHNGKDRGFQLKKFEDKGWGLFDRTTMDVIMGESIDQKISLTKGDKQPDVFGSLLSAATNDPNLLRKQSEGPEVAADRDSTHLPQKPQAAPIQINSRKSIPASSAKSQVVDRIKPAGILKLADETDQQTLRMTFVDRDAEGRADTIDVLVDRLSSVSERPLSQPSPSAKVSVLAACTKPPITEKELRNLQKKILGIATAAAQIEWVEKALTSKCISSQQAMELGSYFTGEADRLKVYQKIYVLIADPSNFGSAVLQFSDKANQALIEQLIRGA